MVAIAEAAVTEANLQERGFAHEPQCDLSSLQRVLLPARLPSNQLRSDPLVAVRLVTLCCQVAMSRANALRLLS